MKWLKHAQRQSVEDIDCGSTRDSSIPLPFPMHQSARRRCNLHWSTGDHGGDERLDYTIPTILRSKTAQYGILPDRACPPHFSVSIASSLRFLVQRILFRQFIECWLCDCYTSQIGAEPLETPLLSDLDKTLIRIVLARLVPHFLIKMEPVLESCATCGIGLNSRAARWSHPNRSNGRIPLWYLIRNCGSDRFYNPGLFTFSQSAW
jgi:hypothetical protein